jgi:hypothetical protein
VNTHACCAGTVSPQRSFTRRLMEAAGCVLPGVMVALLPKCPACLAAWLAIAGIGLSAPAAGRLRSVILILGLVPMLYLAAKAGLRARQARRRAASGMV